MFYRSIYVFVWLLCLTPSGCRRSLPPAADPTKARQALVTALDAWRDGGSKQSLQTASPAIYFNESRFDGTVRLINYRIESEYASGQTWVCEVVLTLRTEQGQEVQRQTAYYINIGSAIVIVPQT